MANRTKSNKRFKRRKPSFSEVKSDPVTLFSERKSRIAPRSGLQFKVGPLFQPTVQVSPLYIKEDNDQAVPRLESRIDRGFELIDGNWIGYKRNYISVVASFTFEKLGNSAKLLQQHGFYIITKNEMFDVKRFAIRLVGKSVEDGDDVSLIQNTAKRDKGPVVEPPVIPVIPGAIPEHIVIREGSNIRNQSRIKEFEQLFSQDWKSLRILQPNSVLKNYPVNENYTKVAKFERIQFTSVVRNKKSIYKNKRFILQIQLLAELDDIGTYAIIAISNTPPVFIRANGASRYESSSTMPNSNLPLDDISNTEVFDLKMKKPIISSNIPKNEYPPDLMIDKSPLAVPGCCVFNPFNGSEMTKENVLEPLFDLNIDDYNDDPELLNPRYFLEKSRVSKIHKLTSSYLNETFSSSFLRPTARGGIQIFDDNKKQNVDNNHDNTTTTNNTNCIAPYLLTNI